MKSGFNIRMNILRGIAILLVLIGHAIFIDVIRVNNVKDAEHLVWLFNFIYTFHMPLFFFISGFFAKRLFEISDKKQYFVYMKDRLFRLGIPYITFSVAGTLSKLIMSSMTNNPVNMKTIVFDILLRPWNNPLKLLWFIYTLFMISALLPVFNKVDNKIKIVVLLVAWCLPINYGSILNLNGIIRYSLFFLIGYEMYLFYPKYLERIKKKIRPLGLTIVLILININPIQSGSFVNVFELVCSLIAILIFVDIVHIINVETKSAKVFNTLGKYSFDIYLLHWFFQMPIRLLYEKIGFNYNILFVVSLFTAFIPILVTKYIIDKADILKLVLFGKIRSKSKGSININNTNL